MAVRLAPLLRVTGLAMMAWATRAGAQVADIVRGRVVDAQNKALPQVEVVVLAEPGAELLRGVTGRDGRFALTIREPRDRYVVSFRAIGFVVASRVVPRQPGSTVVEVGTIQLAPRLDLLEPVDTRAVRQLVPARGERPTLGGASLNARPGAELLSDPSSLEDLIGLLAGTQRTETGISVLGADPSQNRVRVDGADFGGGSLPRDAVERVSLTTHAYDPARGRFSGGEVEVTTRRGTTVPAGQIRVQLLPPFLSWPDAQSAQPRASVAGLSGFFSGPMRTRSLTAFVAADVRHRRAPTTSFAHLESSALDALGIAPADRDAMLVAARQAGLPAVSIDGEDGLRLWAGSASARLDWRLSSTAAAHATYLTEWASLSRGPVGALALPGVATGLTSYGQRLALGASVYAGRFLEEFRASVGQRVDASAPWLDIPGAVVRQATSVGTAREGLTLLRVGGAGDGDSESGASLANLSHTTSWVADEGRHQLQLTQEVVWNRRTQVSGRGGAGIYSFASVADLAGGTPLRYDRVLSSPSVGASDVAVAASLGDIWEVAAGRLQLQGGLRVDWSRFTPPPTREAALVSQFQLTSQRTVLPLSLSPRLGFSWRLSGSAARPLAPLGTTLKGFEGARAGLVPADAAGVSVPAESDGLVLAGGVGAFRGVVPAGDVLRVQRERGRTGGVATLTCAGTSTPIPNWTPGAGGAAACLGGGGEAFSSESPNVTALAPGYRAPTSWRANLTLDGLARWGWGVVPQLSIVRGSDVPSAFDRNLVEQPAFRLANEANRPVYAAPGGIVDVSGVIAPLAGRVTPAFGIVDERRSDLSYSATSLLLGVARQRPWRFGARLYGTYAWSQQRHQQRGFQGVTAGDPREVVWAAGRVPAHEITIGATEVGLGWLRLAARLRATSGSGFTPVVAQDINGDGLANDQAFVFDPSTVPDSAFASALHRLLNGSRASVQQCLWNQTGRIAAINSCRTAWSAQLDLALQLTSIPGVDLGRAGRLSLTVVNAGSAVARLLGTRNGLLGAAAQFPPDTRLLQVVGFDALHQQFRYGVNQRFGKPLFERRGSPRPPFEIHVGLQLPLVRERGLLRSAGASRPAGASPLASDLVRREILTRFLPMTPIDTVLAFADTLHLTTEQQAGIRTIAAAFVARRDRLLAPLVAFAAGNPGAREAAAFNQRLRDAERAVRPAHEQARQQVRSLLTDTQRAALDELLRGRVP